MLFQPTMLNLCLIERIVNIRMKRAFITILIQIVLIMSLSSCSKQSNIATEEPSSTISNQTQSVSSNPSIDLLSPYVLTKSDKDLIKMISSDSNIYIYDFVVNSEIKQVTLWYEEYQKGEKIKSGLPIRFDIDQIKKGSLSIFLDSNNEVKLTTTDGINAQTNTDDITSISSIYNDSTNYAMDISKLEQNTNIETDKDIPLIIYAVNKGDKIELKSPSFYINNKRDLNEFDLAYLFLCKFS